MELSLGAGLWLGLVPVNASVALSIDFGLRIREWLRVSLLLLGTTPAQFAIETRGNLRTFDLATFLTAGACTSGSLSLCGGALGGLRITNAAANTPAVGDRLYSLDGKWAALPELGLYGRLSYLLPLRLFAALEVLAGFPLGVAIFQIKGIADYPTPRVDLMAALRLGVRI